MEQQSRLGLLMKVVSASEGMAGCSLEDLTCRDKTTALHLKGGGIALILVASALGVAVPLVGRRLQYLKTDGNAFFVCKAFAAGVILATGFVHMLPNAMASLTSSCLPANPWSKYPFAGFIAMLAALGTLMIDFLATEYYERRHEHSSNMEKGNMPGHARKLKFPPELRT
jgi:zinc transporter 1/2/3